MQQDKSRVFLFTIGPIKDALYRAPFGRHRQLDGARRRCLVPSKIVDRERILPKHNRRKGRRQKNSCKYFHRSNPKLPKVMVEVLVLRLAPLFSGERAEKRMDIAVQTIRALVVKFGDQLL